MHGLWSEKALPSDILFSIYTMKLKHDIRTTEIFNLAQDTKNMQIKGDKQLEELKSSVEVMSDKFDEYEKDRKEKEKIINGLQNEVSFLKERIDLLEKKV